MVDGSHPEIEQQVRTVLEVLDELGVANKPLVTVINKRDMIDAPRLIRSLSGEVSRPLLISALHGTGIPALMDEIGRVAHQLHPHPIGH
ncbi:GTPase HflX [compost metagenome]